MMKKRGAPPEPRETPKVTLGLDFYPTIDLGNGRIYPRRVEFILNGKYYQKKEPGEWPRDPETGEKLPLANPLFKQIT